MRGWLAPTDPHERALRHGAYEHFVTDTLLAFIRADCGDGSITTALTGCSLGAFHAANFALKHPHLFPYALCLSGRYDVEAITGPSSSSEVYFNNPVAYVSNLGGTSRVRPAEHPPDSGLRAGRLGGQVFARDAPPG